MSITHGPFSLHDEPAWLTWREHKLDAPPPAEPIEIADPASPDPAACAAIARECARHNFALFRFREPPEDPRPALRALGRVFGLDDLDANLCAEDSGLTEISVRATGRANHYIPYTDRPIGWHTDGYYNPLDQQIRGMLLYCHRPAMEGGVNGLLDHEIAYLRLREQNPEWIRALMAPDAFTIPPNIEDGVEIRPATIGPVFTVSPCGRHLHMRYSARQRNVEWKDDPATRDAAAALLHLLDAEPLRVERRLAAGEGVISNNVLHRREGFVDHPDPARRRVMFRARYHDRLGPPDTARARPSDS